MQAGSTAAIEILWKGIAMSEPLFPLESPLAQVIKRLYLDDHFRQAAQENLEALAPYGLEDEEWQAIHCLLLNFDRLSEAIQELPDASSLRIGTA